MLKKLRKYIGLSIFIILSLIYSNSCIRQKTQAKIETKENIQDFLEVEQDKTVEETSAESTDTEKIYVYICGQVNKEGVYELFAGARLVELVEMAGGFSENADKTYNNLAMHLEDEQQIYIPSIGENLAKNSQITSISKENRGDKINLNTATKEELMSLRGLGSSKAEQIIEYRNKNGGFKSIEDIMNIKGIKKAAFNKIKDSIYVE